MIPSKIKKEIKRILARESWREDIIQVIRREGKALHPVFLSCVYDPDETIKFRAIEAMGILLSELEDKEFTKEVIRRCMWILTEESGGIAWGAGEIIGIACTTGLDIAEDYLPKLQSYTYETENHADNYLDYPPLRAGAYWGMAAASSDYPGILDREILEESARIEDDRYILACLKLIFENEGMAFTGNLDMQEQPDSIKVYYRGDFRDIYL
ncbi:MAG: DVU0298 family protein [Bacteroidota bacterium]